MELIEPDAMENRFSIKNAFAGNDITNPRAVGNVIQDIVETNFNKCIPEGILKEFNTSLVRRSIADIPFTEMGDIAFIDKDGKYYVVNIKIHNVDLKFHDAHQNMLCRSTDDNWYSGRLRMTIEKLVRLYENSNNYFTILLIAYEIKDEKIIAKKCHFIPIEHLKMESLTILADNEIQIVNSNVISINPKQTRKMWMLALCDNRIEYFNKWIDKKNNGMKSDARNRRSYSYPQVQETINKIRNSIEYFKKVKNHWECAKK